MHDTLDRRISFGGVALVFGRLKNSGKICTQIKKYLDNF